MGWDTQEVAVHRPFLGDQYLSLPFRPHLKNFLKEEIGRLKRVVQQHIVETPTDSNNENFKKVKAKRDKYSQIPINQQMVEEVFYIQDLIAEVSKNDRQD